MKKDIYIPPPMQLGSFSLGGIWFANVCLRGSRGFAKISNSSTRQLFPRRYPYNKRWRQYFFGDFFDQGNSNFLFQSSQFPLISIDFLAFPSSRQLFRGRYLGYHPIPPTRKLLCRRYLEFGK